MKIEEFDAIFEGLPDPWNVPAEERLKVIHDLTDKVIELTKDDDDPEAFVLLATVGYELQRRIDAHAWMMNVERGTKPITSMIRVMDRRKEAQWDGDSKEVQGSSHDDPAGRRY